MASIRMTAYLRSTISMAGRRLFASAIEKAEGKLDPTFYDRLAQEVYDSRYAARDIHHFPQDWTMKTKGISTTIKSTDSDKPRYAISSTCNASHTVLEINSHVLSSCKFLYMNTFECSDALYDEYYKYKENIVKRTKERDAFQEELNNVLKRCNTLKQFLDLWPHGESLINQQTMAEFNKPPEKRKTIEHVPEDVSAMMSSTLIKRSIVK